VSARAIAFHHAVHATVCDRVEPWEHGTVVFATAHPTYRILNVVRVEDAAEGLDAPGLAAIADRLQAGLTHRAVEVEDEAAGRRLRPGFDALGWDTERLVWMELEGPARGGGVAPLELTEVPFPRTRALRAAWFADEPSDDDDGGDAFFDEVDEVAARRGARALMAFDGAGDPAGYVTFTVAGDAAAVDEAYVDRRHRGAGIGGALVAAAVSAAGVARTWIVADDEGAPKRLYARLGFEPAWRQHSFVRLPHSSAVRLPPAKSDASRT
jgi:GNAT superfamily N-acetyltransferase